MSTVQKKAPWSRRRLAVVCCSGAVMAVGIGGAVSYAVTSSRSGLPPAKAALVGAQRAALAKAQAHPMPKSQAGPPPQWIQPSSSPPLTGIFASHQAPFSPSWFFVQNAWTGEVNGQYYTLYAGQKEHPRSGASPQAGVIVYADPANAFGSAQPRQVGIYLLGGSAGPLQIQGTQGSKVALVRPGGLPASFDVSSMSFAAS